MEIIWHHIRWYFALLWHKGITRNTRGKVIWFFLRSCRPFGMIPTGPPKGASQSEKLGRKYVELYSRKDMLHKSHNAPVSYPTMHHLATEMCMCAFLLQNGALWDIHYIWFVWWVLCMFYSTNWPLGDGNWDYFLIHSWQKRLLHPGMMCLFCDYFYFISPRGLRTGCLV